MEISTKKIFVVLLSIILIGCSASDRVNVMELEYPTKLKVIKRAEWGSVHIDTTFETHEIKYITIHHGGVEFYDQEHAAEHVKNLQNWSREEKNWIDIPYHFMIDLEGNIYEARPINIPGDTNTEYDPTNHALIEVIGNYEVQELSEIQLKSMIDLTKYLMSKFEVSVEKVKTHKDYSALTVCPGKNVYKYFEDGSIYEALGN